MGQSVLFNGEPLASQCVISDTTSTFNASKHIAKAQVMAEGMRNSICITPQEFAPLIMELGKAIVAAIEDSKK